MITQNIPVIDRDKIPNNIWKLIDDDCFGDNRLNAYQLLYLVDEDDVDDTPIEIVTKYFREQGILSNRVLIDNTW